MSMKNYFRSIISILMFVCLLFIFSIQVNGEGVIQSNSRRYTLVDDKLLSWNDAALYCETAGGYLATVSSSEEQKEISELIGNRYVWIGLSDAKKEGTWSWSSKATSLYRYWDARQPVQSPLYDCAAIKAINLQSKWYNEHCSKLMNFVCDTPATYQVIFDQGLMTWEEAENYCKLQFRTNLATIKNIADEQKIVEIAQGYPVLIGLNKRQSEEWKFSSGAALSWSAWFNGDTFFPSEPSNFTSNQQAECAVSNKDCTELFQNVIDGKWSWYTTECDSTKRFFVCDTETSVEPNKPGFPISDSRHQFIFVSSPKLTWTEAQLYCKENFNDGHLATILNKDEHESVLKLVLNQNSGNPAWIGANDIEIEGKWKWISNNREVEYANFYISTPSWLNASTNDCAAIGCPFPSSTKCANTRQLYWFDKKCNSETKLSFICQIKKPKSSPTMRCSSFKSKPSCQSKGYCKWSNNQCKPNTTQESKKKFIWVKKIMEWKDALINCKSLGGTLAILKTKEDLDKANEFLENAKDCVWVGASDLGKEGDWRWVDGTSLPLTSDYWLPGEPNNSYYGESEDCAVLRYFHLSKFNDLSCKLQRGSLCEIYDGN